VCLEDKPTWTRLSGMMLCPEKLRERFYSHRSGYVVLERGRGPRRLLCWLKGHVWKVEKRSQPRKGQAGVSPLRSSRRAAAERVSIRGRLGAGSCFRPSSLVTIPAQDRWKLVR
jgi:hypothetical protein